jgi:hypothetical protein
VLAITELGKIFFAHWFAVVDGYARDQLMRERNLVVETTIATSAPKNSPILRWRS